MKKPIIIMSFLLGSFTALAQQPQPGNSYWKDRWKSVLKQETAPAPSAIASGAWCMTTAQFQKLLKNREQRLAYETPGDRVHIAKPDNMPVLVPDMTKLEKMPGSHRYTPAPPSKMPNPLYPRKKPGN